MTYQQPKPTREENIKRNAQNFLIAAIRATGTLGISVDAAISLAVKLHDAKIPPPNAS